MTSRTAIARIFAANLGGWLAIMPAAVVTIALRLRQFDASGLPSQYSLILASGWLALIVCLILAGQIGDVLHARTGSRVLLMRLAIPAMLALGLLLAFAPSPGWLCTWWVLLQVPVAVIITTTLASSGELIRPGRRGATSGLIGASSIIALFVGTAIAEACGEALGPAVWLPVVIGAALCLPFAILHRSDSVALEVSVEGTEHPTSPARALWAVFLLASLLLSWATSTANGYLVLLVEHVSAVAEDSVASTSTRLVLLASAAAVFSSLLLGPAARTRRIAAITWSGAAAICGLALFLLIGQGTETALTIAALLFGLAFGAANGVELALILFLRNGSVHLGRDLGLFTSVTTLPYVLVPALGSLALADDPRSGLIGMFAVATVLALIGALLAALIAARRTAATT